MSAVATYLLAQSDGSGGLFQDPWAWGLGGVLFLLVASGRLIVPTFVYDREKNRADRLETEAKALNNQVQEKTIPALLEASAAVREATAMQKEYQEAERWRRRYGPSEPS